MARLQPNFRLSIKVDGLVKLRTKAQLLGSRVLHKVFLYDKQGIRQPISDSPEYFGGDGLYGTIEVCPPEGAFIDLIRDGPQTQIVITVPHRLVDESCKLLRDCLDLKADSLPEFLHYGPLESHRRSFRNILDKIKPAEPPVKPHTAYLKANRLPSQVRGIQHPPSMPDLQRPRG